MLLGEEVGSALGTANGISLGETVGSALGTAYGTVLGVSAGGQLGTPLGSGEESGICAWSLAQHLGCHLGKKWDPHLEQGME